MVASTVFLAVLAALPALTNAAQVPAYGNRALDHGALVRRVVAHGDGTTVGGTRSRARRRQCRPKTSKVLQEAVSSVVSSGFVSKPASTEAAPSGSDKPAPTETASPGSDKPASTEAAPSGSDESAPTAGSETAASHTATPEANANPSAAPTQELSSSSAEISQPSASPALPNVGLLIANGACGASSANAYSPNGQEWWLNCGLDGSGWTPPYLTFEEIKSVELTADGVYAPCAPYFDKFKKYGAVHNIPPIMVAAIAMMESNCNPTLIGGAGEVGMMQLGESNCRAANGDCADVDYNIDAGVKYLRFMIDGSGGSVLLGLGAYNGWTKGMTKETVDEMAKKGCSAQPNMDYLDQVLNGWLQGSPGYNRGQWKNRANCDK